MKYILFIMCLQISYLTYGQDNLLAKVFEKSIIRNFDIPNNLYLDSCYYTNILLKVGINKKSKVFFMSFSDNVEDWLAKELSRTKEKLEIKLIEELARKNHIRNGNILIPIIIRSGSFLCKDRTNFYWFKKNYFQFNGRNLQGKNFFVDPVEIILLSSVN